MYHPLGVNISTTDLSDLFSELPTPGIVVGDFNAHNSFWGSTWTCQRGKLLEQLLAMDNLLTLNTGETTHVCIMARGIIYSIDLTLCSRSIAPHLDWTVLSDF